MQIPSRVFCHVGKSGFLSCVWGIDGRGGKGRARERTSEDFGGKSAGNDCNVKEQSSFALFSLGLCELLRSYSKIKNNNTSYNTEKGYKDL